MAHQPLRAVDAAPGDISDFLPRPDGRPGPYARYLLSEGKAQGTVDKYVAAVEDLRRFLVEHSWSTHVAEVQKPQLQEYMAAMLAAHKSSTANTRFYSLRAFFTYLLEDDEIRWDPMAGMSPPPAPAPPVPVLPAETINALLKTCKSSSFEDRRDAALIMVLYDTGCRASECAGMLLSRTGDGSAQVLGKGSKWRTVHYGLSTARVLDRYLRIRDRHAWADEDNLWLGTKGPMTRFGIRSVLDKRAKLAGVDHIHAHQFRHTFAHEWLADGGQETDLMRLTGWSSRTMVGRYAASAADARAAENYKKKLSPADKLKGQK